jgi:hypothetical protein
VNKCKLGLFGFLLLTLCVSLQAQTAIERKPINEVDTDALTRETQHSKSTDNSLILCWVIPQEFWEASLSGNPDVPLDQQYQLLDALDNYLLVGVVRADVSDFGAFNFIDEESTFNSLRISYAKDGGEYAELQMAIKADDPNTQLLIDTMKPMLRQALGSMGENFHLFVCDNMDDAGNRLVSPYDKSKLKVDIAAAGDNPGTEMVFEFPLNSLHVARICADCNKPADIHWSYCPFCGKPLGGPR